MHTGLLTGSLLSNVGNQEANDCHEKKEIKLQGENVFTIARLLQYIYYGTYTIKAHDLVQATDNLTRPGFVGFSPVMIVRAGVTTESDDTLYASLLSRDNATTTSFAQDIHLDLYKLAVKYQIQGLEEDTLENYSSFPFRNHREFYQSVIDIWPNFPFIDYGSTGHYYDRDVLRAVAPHIAKFWKEARKAERHASGVEGRRILKWIKGKQQANRELKDILLNVFAGIDSDEEDD